MPLDNSISYVIDAAIKSYELNGFDVKMVGKSEESIYFDFFIPKKRRVEKIYSSVMFETANLEKYEEYRNNGFEVWVIVPLSSIGKAHEAFRNRADWIQGWWIENSFIKFGSPQRP